MNSNRSAAPAHHRRRLDRLAGFAVALGLSMAAMPAIGLGSGRARAAGDGTSFGLIDLSEAGEALSRGELPLELLVAGSLAAVAVGFSLTILVGALRRRRSAPRPEPVPAEPTEYFVDARTTLPWPTEDADAFRTAPPPDDASPAIDEQAPAPFAASTPSAPRDAAWAERWAAHEATSEIARQSSGLPSDAPAEVTPETATAPETVQPPPPPEVTEVADTATVDTVDTVDTGSSAGMARTWERPDPPLPPAAISAIESTLATRTEAPFARSTLGTPDSPLVVELRDERDPGPGRRAGPNLPLVAVIGTVAVGVAFAAGAAVGAALGVGAGAAIGLAFAGGAGVAIGATVALLGGSRR